MEKFENTDYKKALKAMRKARELLKEVQAYCHEQEAVELLEPIGLLEKAERQTAAARHWWWGEGA